LQQQSEWKATTIIITVECEAECEAAAAGATSFIETAKNQVVPYFGQDDD
jgi:hypothetical protein